MTVTIEVFEADLSTLVDTIDPGQFKSAHGEHKPLNGIGNIVLPRTINGAANPALALIEHQRLIRFTDDHDDVGADPFVWTMEIEVVVDVPLSDQEEAGETVTVSGRDWLSARMDKVHVLPDAGLNNLPWHPTRWFNFSADRLRDDDPDGPQGEWPFGVNTPPDYDDTNLFGRPEGMVNTDPQWIWSEDSTSSVDAGVCYFRQRYSLGDAQDVYFEFAADDEGELWVDGVPLIKLEGVYKGGCLTATVPLSLGGHVISGFGRNLNALRAGVTASWWSISDGMPDELLGQLDETLCRTLGYPAAPPGFTPTEQIRLVVDEQQDIDRIPGVGFSFTSAADTGENEVLEYADLTARAPGDTLLTLLKVLQEHALDIDCDYAGGGTDAESNPCDLLIHAWLRGFAGEDLVSTVIFEKGTANKITHEVRSNEIATVALVSGNTFAPFQEPESYFGDIYEVSLDFGDASEEMALRLAQAYLDLIGAGRFGVSLDLNAAGPLPGRDFNVYDYVGVLYPDGGVYQSRVAGVAFDLNADSIVRYSAEMDQPSQALDERLAMLMRKQMPGAAGGRTILPSPVEPTFSATQAGKEETHTWQWDGPLGEIQVYINGTEITTAVVDAGDLTTAGDTKGTTVTGPNDDTDERRYVRKVDKLQISAGGGALSPSWVPTEGRWVQEVRATVSDDEETIVITLMVA